MSDLGTLVRDVEPHGLLSLGDQLVFYQSHHHSLFLDQSIEDALGGEAWAIRRNAAFDASRALLEAIHTERGVTGEKDRLDVASEIFAAMGHGRVTFDVTPSGGTARAEALHFGSGFMEKYGGTIRNRRMLDAFAAGYCAAAVSLAYPSDWGAFDAVEIACVARREPACIFNLTRQPSPSSDRVVLTRALAESIRPRAPDGDGDGASGEALSAKGASVARMLSGLSWIEGGVVRAFGLRLALIPLSYTNQITYDTSHLLEKRAPELLPVFTALAREAAVMGGYHLLAGALASPGFAASSGAIAKEPAARLQQILAIARSLGWGALRAVELEPGRTLVLRAPVTPESVYYAARQGNAMTRRLPFLQGIALAIMLILHRVDFGVGPLRLTRDAYNALFRSGTRFFVEETRSPLRGDDVCEVLVEAIAD